MHKMRVGDLLKTDIEGVPGLQYPYKIIINEKCKYPYFQRIENEIFLENCIAFVNEFPSNKQFNKHRSFSQKKRLIKINNIQNNTYYTKKFFLKKHSDNFEKKSLIKNTLIDKNLPILRESSTPKTNIKINWNIKKNDPILLNDCLLIKNKIKRLKSETKNLKSLTFYGKNRKTVNNFHQNSQYKMEKYFNSNKNNNTIMNKTQKRKNIFEYIIQKIRKM